MTLNAIEQQIVNQLSQPMDIDALEASILASGYSSNKFYDAIDYLYQAGLIEEVRDGVYQAA